MRFVEELTIRLEDPMSEAAVAIVRAYLDDVVGRFHGRRLTKAELEVAVREFPNEELKAPRGLFWIARLNHRAVGCVGLRLDGGSAGEVTRLYVDSCYRRRGIARRLMEELEDHGRQRGLTRLRLDTRHDLIEARRLYAQIGFAEVDPFNQAPYAEHWFERELIAKL